MLCHLSMDTSFGICKHIVMKFPRIVSFLSILSRMQLFILSVVPLGPSTEIDTWPY